ncbi:TRAP transporter substrate-binding protein [Jannaschia aquimarina]|uniref:DctP_7 protein n=1 Tax=Jannaschia aquimarina TaxID=935700 RepID=A0A0D1CJS9_9RHOB|nr:TRAP transporter substrate-binding protein [Jannaschia aquimarina]KIT14987.1 C4-dicarboxylate-binding periplasmic protein precursor [Jannaschia aquimarina]SNS61281.1 TRAP-type C4-dicarboxylate transport system, substrate-binding protein [Jannaschia aquimarina]
MTNRRTVLAAAALALTGLPAAAQEVTLKLHQFLPAQANVPMLILDVWADNVEAASNGRIEVERYPSMQLGGVPPELMDQAIDGVADVVWTVVGYTPGRFPRTEVFELPFMTEDARATSYAYWKLFEEEMGEDFPGVEILGTWVHGPGMFHTADPVENPEDLQGMKIRGGGRLVNAMLERLGAEPIGMPVPAIPEALSKGVIDGTTIPWEVTPAIRVPELVEFHTEFEGPALYNLTFVLAMNEGTYDGLPDDLKQIIDEQSGQAFSIFAGGTQADADGPARQVAVDNGNEIVTISSEQAEAWREAAQPIYDEWIAEMEGKGIDGQALIDRARALMEEYDSSLDTYAPL